MVVLTAFLLLPIHFTSKAVSIETDYVATGLIFPEKGFLNLIKLVGIAHATSNSLESV